MDNILFDELINSNDYVNAYTVAKNLYCRNLGLTDLFVKYADLGLKMASFDITIEERKRYLNEVSNALSLFAENVDVTREVLNILSEYEVKIHDAYEKITLAEDEFIASSKKLYEDDNTRLLTQLGKLNTAINKASSQKEFDKLLEQVNELDAKMAKDFFTEEQEKTYKVLSQHFSESLSSKMEDLHRSSLIELNREAALKFKEAFDRFTSKKNNFKESESNLKSLLITTLFAYDTRDLLNETLVYYNHVYAMIFNEVNDDLKYKITEWSLTTNRIKR